MSEQPRAEPALPRRRRRRRRRAAPPSRLGRLTDAGLTIAGIAIAVLGLAWFLFGAEWDPARSAQRASRSEGLAGQAVAFLQGNDQKGLERFMAATLESDPDVLSIGVRRESGVLVAQTATHPVHWRVQPGGRSTFEHVQVPIKDGGEVWGHVEIAYRPVDSPLEWIEYAGLPTVLLVVLGSALFYVAMVRRSRRQRESRAGKNRAA